MYLTEVDSRWAEHSGEEGHYGDPEWGPEDLERAAVFLAELAPQARRVFEYLLRNPGRVIHCTELVDKVLGGSNEGDPARRVAGVLSGMSKGHSNSGRRFPFYWWEAPEGSAGATYAVRPSVAAVFLAAQLGQ
ncbi:DUF6416 domain-containing protein [Streptomyces sp. NPDC001978]|uniref:DUF6416 domain-containing protein n=1 Tax=Streptomyces sp. NPDC001978 TaxID=3364627 RepID=UPI0036CD623E